MRRLHLLVGLCLAIYCCQLQAIETAEIPEDAPDDDVMATPDEIQQFHQWASEAFQKKQITPAGSQKLELELRRQDHGELGFGQSCIGTPLKIGSQQFKRGLGTHANSEIVLRFPEGARSFRAAVGVDNNYDTQGKRGSVVFIVQANGKELHRTPTLRGGQEPVPLDIALPAGCTALTLIVETANDGPAHDQADWADARLVFENGSELWADANPLPFLEIAVPFSFVYNQVSSSVLLPEWKFETAAIEQSRRNLRKYIWTDSKTGLRVTAEAATFKHYPAVEWVLYFENTGTQDTPVLEQIRALDTSLRTGYERQPLLLHRLTGDICGEQSFMPLVDSLSPGQIVSFAPEGGRPSNGAFPFFNIQYGNKGIIAGIGWSGQWVTRLERFSTGRSWLQAGMEQVRLRLHPGERIRSPRILLLGWQGDRLQAHNRFRRLLLFEYMPKQNGRPLRMPVALQCFDRYSYVLPEWATEEGQLLAVKAASALGCDTYWFDAAWFEGGFPNGVGNWFCKPKSFPRGLAPMAEACQKARLQHLVWFEPERVAPRTQIALEHPEFVIGGTNGGLFKLHEPAARKWLADLLSQRITEFGLNVYRNDFNIDPLNYWRKADPPEREGMTEIRYVEGHYALWDELLARHPGLWIDNCASGGRRIDLETISRSVTLWRSDTGCTPGHEEWDQLQVMGFALYIPLFSSCAWEPQSYISRSAAAAGAIFQFDYLNKKFPWAEARAAVSEATENQKYWYGDFYPLVSTPVFPEGWVAWQLHRPDLDAGMVLAFRRRNTPYSAFQASLHALKPECSYRVEWIDEHRRRKTRTMKGKELMSCLELPLPKQGTSLLVRYRAK